MAVSDELVKRLLAQNDQMASMLEESQRTIRSLREQRDECLSVIDQQHHALLTWGIRQQPQH